MTPSEMLKIITDIQFEPIAKPTDTLIIRNFYKINDLNLSAGKEIEVEGLVTYVPRELNERDRDLHFNLSPSLHSEVDQSRGNVTGQTYIICEIQNASTFDHKVKLANAMEQKKRVKVKGYFRMFLEHVDNESYSPHIFEIHPVTKVWIEDIQLKNITVDCPDRNDWKNNASIYEMIWGDEKSGLSFVNYVERRSYIEMREDKIQTSYDKGNLTFTNLTTPHEGKPAVGFNYVFAVGFFVKILKEAFPEGSPYLFEIKTEEGNNNSSNIKCIVTPETLAYDLARSFHYKPPAERLLAVAMRNMHILSLFENKFETTLYPVFRLEKLIA
jgi:hypothetical protein